MLTSGRVPVPRLITVDTVEPAWFAMSWAPGEAVEPVLDGVTLGPGLARTRARRAVQTLAVLHSIDASPLLDGAAPVTPAEELTRWATVLPRPRSSCSWRPARCGAGGTAADPDGTVDRHGLYRLGNILFEGAEPRAVVDWELWSIGDPRVDLGYFGVFADHRNFPEIGTEVAELPSERELAEIYRRSAGRDSAT